MLYSYNFEYSPDHFFIAHLRMYECTIKQLSLLILIACCWFKLLFLVSVVCTSIITFYRASLFLNNVQPADVWEDLPDQCEPSGRNGGRGGLCVGHLATGTPAFDLLLHARQVLFVRSYNEHCNLQFDLHKTDLNGAHPLCVLLFVVGIGSCYCAWKEVAVLLWIYMLVGSRWVCCPRGRVPHDHLPPADTEHLSNAGSARTQQELWRHGPAEQLSAWRRLVVFMQRFHLRLEWAEILLANWTNKPKHSTEWELFRHDS